MLNNILPLSENAPSIPVLKPNEIHNNPTSDRPKYPKIWKLNPPQSLLSHLLVWLTTWPQTRWSTTTFLPDPIQPILINLAKSYPLCTLLVTIDIYRAFNTVHLHFLIDIKKKKKISSCIVSYRVTALPDYTIYIMEFPRELSSHPPFSACSRHITELTSFSIKIVAMLMTFP